MKLFRTLLFFACALSWNNTYAQNLMNIHQGNGTLIQIPLESIDSVRFVTVPPPTIQKIFQSNGNILSIAVSDIDSITYTIPNNAALATISTQAVTVLSSSSAYSGGTITSDGGSAITQRGVCWSTSPNPTLANNFSVDGTGIGSYGSNLSPLQSATTYYVRAYAVNSEGTAYGNQLTFTTANPSTSGSLSVIITAEVTYTDGLTASCGGNITADGGLAVTARGVCWAIGTTPTINNNITMNGAGAGNYTSTLTNLLPNTSYFVRAYATNDAGTAYGVTYSFTTYSLPIVTTDSITYISYNAAIAFGSIASDGGSAVTQRGFCYSLNPNPTLNDNFITNGNGLGMFYRIVTGLQGNTTYYARAYATNGVGTSYGIQQTFETYAGNNIITIPGNDVTFDGYTYNTIILGNGQEWFAENLRTTTYANGEPITNVTNIGLWSGLETGSWAHYDNNNQYEIPYGKLYNWYAVSDSRNLCPTGWHVPALYEFYELIFYLDENADLYNPFNPSTLAGNAGGKMKSTGSQYWSNPNSGASNESAFSALPGGSIGSFNSIFESLGDYAFFWTSTEGSTNTAYNLYINSGSASIFRNRQSKSNGRTVRCLKD